MTVTAPFFLTLELTLQVHAGVIRTYGGSDGVREMGLIESAVAQGRNACVYGGEDLFGIAAAYAYHLAESQAFVDGNKRTGAAAALVFLLINGADITRITSQEVHEMMIKLATKELSKAGLADLLRSRLG